jgi:beta-aspartyl-peptidase (threonine type)
MPDDAIRTHEAGIANALAAGYALLERGGSAVDAVEAAVTVMENDEAFDAGRGSFLTRDGRVQLDALLMNGENLHTGGVACVERLRNPIRAARLVLDHSPHVYFVGNGAERFARQHGMQLIDNTELIVPRERERLMAFQEAELEGATDTTFSGPLHLDKEKEGPEDPTLASHDTVGAVALDKHGHIAAGTSTGEPIMKLVLGKWAVDRVAAGVPPEMAAEAAIEYLYTRLGGHGGIILLDRQGRIGLAHNTPRMAWGLQTVEGTQIGVTRNG